MDSDHAYMYCTHCVGCGGLWCDECRVPGTNVCCTYPGSDDDTMCDGYLSGFCKVGWSRQVETS